MLKDRLFNTLAVLLFVITVVQIGGLYSGLDKQIEWWDTATHFLGGVWIGGMALWFLSRKKGVLPAAAFAILFALAAAFGIGFIWEIYEIAVLKIIGLAFFPDYLRDTITDLIADSAGGISAAFLFLFLRLRKK